MVATFAVYKEVKHEVTEDMCTSRLECETIVRAGDQFSKWYNISACSSSCFASSNLQNFHWQVCIFLYLIFENLFINGFISKANFYL